MTADAATDLRHGSVTRVKRALAIATVAAIAGWAAWTAHSTSVAHVPHDRQRVVFWHFWGGRERAAVQDIVRRFNESQPRYWVVETPIPGQNLDMKFFMALAGGDFPDVLNQDDQVIAQWAHRGVLRPLRELAGDDDEYEQLLGWLNPAARRIGTYQGELFALCNAIDIRALIFRRDALDGRDPPRTIAELDAIAQRPGDNESRIPFLPDDRRLWAWGAVFGGQFFDETSQRVTANDPKIVAALEWMVSYTRFHGLQKVRAFRSTNRETGAGSMLLDGRYGLMMDGQWRIPELDEARRSAVAAGEAPVEYGVAPLPVPDGGRDRAGWVNGNFFVVPRGCRNPAGAWEFMKFWAGFRGNEKQAAVSAASGGWIPASRHVVEQQPFQEFLRRHPNFRLFVDLADSPHQFPTPAIPVQAYFFERVNRAAEEALSLSRSPQEALDEATRDIQARLDAVSPRPAAGARTEQNRRTAAN